MSRSKFEVWIMVPILASMVACKDSVESHYASAASAAQAGMFEHGWLPEILKPDSQDITVWYDIASNEVRGKFAMNPALTERVRSICKPANDKPRKTWWMPGWFPASITQGELGEHGLQSFRCDDYFVAVDPHNSDGYFWETEKQDPQGEPSNDETR